MGFTVLSNRLFENSIYRVQASYNKVEICFDFIFCSDYNFNHTMQRNLSNCVLESIILGGSTMQSILPGMYRHYKGNHYQVLYLAKHSETLEDMVVYQALYGERGIWVRPASMWNEIVNYQGKQVKRFTYIETE